MNAQAGIVLFLGQITSVGGFCLTICQLNCYEATLYVRILNALHVAIFNLGKWHVLIVLLVVVIDQVANKLFSVHICLLLQIKVLEEEKFVLLLDSECVQKDLFRIVVEHAQEYALIFHRHALEESL